MRSVSGTVASSKPISLSKAAVALSSFVAGGTGASRDVAAHLQRASLAFDDLVRFHRDLRARRRSDVGKVERRKKKKKGDEERPEVVEERDGLGDGNLTEVERDDGDNGAKGEKEKKKRAVKATDHGQAKEESLETEAVSSENRRWNMKLHRKDEALRRELDEHEEPHKKKNKKKRKIQAA